MSSIRITDQRGGVYQAVIEFTYGECERLPFNLLRRVNAKISVIPNGGIKATTEFNIRSQQESTAFLEMLDMFGDGGSYVHGSAAEPAALALISPPHGVGGVPIDDDGLEIEDESGKGR